MPDSALGMIFLIIAIVLLLIFFFTFVPISLWKMCIRDRSFPPTILPGR